MFDIILKILFSYKIFTFSQSFSQHPNKFYYKNFNIYTLKKQKSAQNNSLNFIQIWSNWEREEERVIENFRERETTTRPRRDRDDEIIGAMRSRRRDRRRRWALGREREWERRELRTWRSDLAVAFRVGAWFRRYDWGWATAHSPYSLFSLSLSLSLSLCASVSSSLCVSMSSESDLKVK